MCWCPLKLMLPCPHVFLYLSFSHSLSHCVCVCVCVYHSFTLSFLRIETDFIGEELHIDIDNLSQEQLTSLQNNFNALQQRFVALMAEKAEIIDQFQEQEHTIMQLASETETIGM